MLLIPAGTPGYWFRHFRVPEAITRPSQGPRQRLFFQQTVTAFRVKYES